MKFINYRCPNCGDSIQFEKGDSTSFCESCGSKLHVEQDTSDKIFRAFDLVKISRFIAAANLFSEILTVDSKNGQAYLGLLLCDTECTGIAGLASTKYSFINNLNYTRALEFLPLDQINELVALCNQNPANDSSLNAPPTASMKELARLNDLIFGGGFTIVQLYYNTDFSDVNENKVILFFRKTTEHMEKMISIYNTLSDNEKKRVPNFNIKEFEGAVNVYIQIREIIKSAT